jgi:23S rRNA (cytidine1920-2'-O)/16S rRNA (cytidine1409-2'-O)-methyltransferase
MARRGRTRLRSLVELVAREHPFLEDPSQAIAGGKILVDGRVLTNPATLVRVGASVVVRADAPLRGEAKLRAALEAFAVRLDGRVALDLGAAAGGFTRILLDAGARRVYAVDVGHGQLLGSLRQDPRVVNLERTNLAELSSTLVPEVDVVTADLSYVALAAAIPQLNGRVRLAADADLVALVKPQFELGLPEPPTEPADLARARTAAAGGIAAAGWAVTGVIPSPVRGTRGSAEFLLHARRGQSDQQQV